MRIRLQDDLGYQYTQRIPMHLPNAVAVYDMVFATDHWAGDNIMRASLRSGRTARTRHDATGKACKKGI